MAKRLTAFLTVATLLYSTPGLAKTTYFNCKVTTPGQEAEYRVSTDDDRSEVTYEVVSNGNIFKRPAIFTADSVKWTGDGTSDLMKIQFSISRIDLSFDVSVFIGGKVMQPRLGKCEIAEAPKRAF